ncbi:MAG: dihydrolipoyl dehydrogenase [Dehalococcoidales bacterium]|nr:dihydrolipoyl dehydrogenase [Dehalococcoidales bacterium]
MEEKDVIVIGGGSAGFLAAQRVAMHGGSVKVVEEKRLGGICPNWGCIPMCFLERCVEVIRTAREAYNDGIDTGEVKIDFARMMKEKNRVVGGVVEGMEARLRSVGVEVVTGAGRLLSPAEVEITSDGRGKEIVRAKKIIIATGSTARRYSIPGATGAGVLTVRDLLDLKELPDSLAVIGRGAAAVELAALWANLGSRVNLIARKRPLLPGEDEELAELVRSYLETDGVCVYAGADVLEIGDSPGGKAVNISYKGNRHTVEARFVVFALGQNPNIESLGLENAGVVSGEDGIKTDEMMETSTRGIYAAGDVTGGMMLASIAMKQGTVAADNAMGKKNPIDYRVVPRFIRTLPPLASVGLTEAQARENGLNIRIGRCPFELNPKARILRESRGLVKIIADEVTEEVFGVHILGAQATELIHEPAAIMKMRGSVMDIASLVHAHPCLHESIQRAAQSMLGKT